MPLASSGHNSLVSAVVRPGSRRVLSTIITRSSSSRSRAYLTACPWVASASEGTFTIGLEAGRPGCMLCMRGVTILLPLPSQNCSMSFHALLMLCFRCFFALITVHNAARRHFTLVLSDLLLQVHNSKGYGPNIAVRSPKSTSLWAHTAAAQYFLPIRHLASRPRRAFTRRNVTASQRPLASACNKAVEREKLGEKAGDFKVHKLKLPTPKKLPDSLKCVDILRIAQHPWLKVIRQVVRDAILSTDPD